MPKTLMLNRMRLLALAFGTAIGVGAGNGALRAQEGSINLSMSIVRPADDLGVEKEFRELHALLDLVPENFGGSRAWNGPDPCSDLAARLSVFPSRFGTDPRLAPQWPAFQSAAQDLLNTLDNPTTREPLTDYDTSRQMDRATLLDIVGRTDEVRAILEGGNVYGPDGCLTCTADRGIVVYQRRSEACERAGDLQGALRWQQEACFELPMTIIGHGHPGEDLLHARYGLLLCRTGHGAEGGVVLRAVTGMYPHSIGAQLARAELTRRGVPADGPKAAIEVLLLNWGGNWRMCAGLAVSDERQPGWLQILAVRLPNHGDEPGSHTVACDPEGLEEIRPVFEKFIPHDGPVLWEPGRALRIAQGLRAGAAPYLEMVLERMRANDSAADPGAASLDATLRWLYAGGPTLSASPDESTGAHFADAWREWLKKR